MITSYKDLSVNKYLELQELLVEECDDLSLQAQLIGVLADMSEDDVLALSLDEYQRMVANTSFLLEKPKLNKHIPNSININGAKYKICKDVPSLNVAQYIDYQTLTASDDKDKLIAQILSCFIVPEGHTYGDGKYDNRTVIEAIGDHLSIQDAVSVCFFFHRKYRRLIEDTLIYLDWKMKRMKRKAKDEATRTKMTEAMNQVETLRALLQSGTGLSS